MSVFGVNPGRDQLVLSTGRDFKWNFENLDIDLNPTDFPDGRLFFELATGNAHNCIQRVEVKKATGGEYKLLYDGTPSDPIDYYDGVDTPYDLTIDIRSALENIPAIGAGNVDVSLVGMSPVWDLNFILSGSNQNEIQELVVTNLLGWLGEALGEGKMVLSYRENDSEPISFESNAATIQAALEDIPQIGVGNVIVTEPTSDHFHIEFVGLLAARDVDQIKVSAYKQNADDFFGGGITANLLTRFYTKTIQNGRKAILNGRMMDTLSKKILEFFKLFDDAMPMALDFVIHSNTHFTVEARSTKGYTEIDLVTFDVIFNAASVMTFINNQVLLAGAVNTVTVDQYWNYEFDVEFVNGAGNKPHPQLVGDASLLTNSITEIPLTPEVNTSYVEQGLSEVTTWDFELDGHTATIKVESETADLVADNTYWQLVFLADGESAGGDPIGRGRVRRVR